MIPCTYQEIYGIVFHPLTPGPRVRLAAHPLMQKELQPRPGFRSWLQNYSVPMVLQIGGRSSTYTAHLYV